MNPSQRDPLAPLFDDEGGADLAAIVTAIREEAESLGHTLPGALSRQWNSSPVPKPRHDTTERAQGQPADPTADTVLDRRRLLLREQVIASEHALRRALASLRATSTALERAVSRWDGDR